MRLKPFDIDDVEIPDVQEIDIDEVISAVAAPQGNMTLGNGSISTLKKNDTKGVFDKAGASIDTAAKQLARVMQFGDTDTSRLKAAELVLKVHEVFRDLEKEQSAAPRVEINIVNSQNVNIVNNLLMPIV